MSTQHSDAPPQARGLSPYRLTAPCRRCPFRTDVEPYLRPERAEGIALNILSGGQFHCHQTTVCSEDGSDMEVGPDSAVCAGALIVMEKSQMVNQTTRIAERVGLYDPARLHMDAPVAASFNDWTTRFRDPAPTVTITHPDGSTETLEYEHCGVVGPECEDPAGYAAGGGAVENTEEPTCDPTKGCTACGDAMCGPCATMVDGDRVCIYCAERYDDIEEEL